MSLIGPRPLLVKYLPYYNDEEKLRHDLYVEHTHECNLIAYAGLSILFAFGAYKEYVAVSNNI